MDSPQLPVRPFQYSSGLEIFVSVWIEVGGNAVLLFDFGYSLPLVAVRRLINCLDALFPKVYSQT